jgi:branched-chain amino acid transport system permease protein
MIVQSLVSGLMAGLVYALISVGLSLVYGLMDIVNFAHGEFLMLGMFTAFWCYSLFGLDPLVSWPIAAAAIALLGIVSYYLVVHRVLKSALLAQIFATFGLALLLRNGAQALWSPDYRSANSVVKGQKISFLGINLGWPEIIAGIGAILAFGALYLFMNRTRYGAALQATAEDREAAAMMGINTDRVFAVGWGLAGACVGLAGALLMAFYPVYPDAGVQFGLIAYVAVALGGFGSVAGALVGGVFIGVVEVLAGGIVPEYKLVIVFSLYLLVVLVRPKGLLGAY